MDTITFDIETIPRQDTLSIIQYQELKKIIRTRLKKMHPNGCTFSQYKDVRSLVMATNPNFGQIVVIGLQYNRMDGATQSISIQNTNEKALLERFWQVIKDKNVIFISYNGLNFDIPFIIRRSMIHGIEITNRDFLQLKRFSKNPHFDVKLVLGDWDKFAPGTLELFADLFNIPTPKDGEVNAKSVEKAVLDGNIDKVAEYCLKDVTVTYQLYNIVKQYSI